MFKYYDYECRNDNCPECNETVERFVLPSEVNEQECSKCHQIMTRVISAVKGWVKNPASGKATKTV